MFAEYQLFADETSPFKHTMRCGYSNGSAGHVATKKDWDLGLAGGYGAALWNRHPPDPSARKLIQDGITQLFCELKPEQIGYRILTRESPHSPTSHQEKGRRNTRYETRIEIPPHEHSD